MTLKYIKKYNDEILFVYDWALIGYFLKYIFKE